MSWTPVIPGVWSFPDSCRVYAVQGPAGMVIFNAGTGYWLEHLAQLPMPPQAVILTHYFRDHAAGAAAAAGRGLAVWAPAGDLAIIREPAEHLRRRETYIIYDNLWDLFVPIEGVPTVQGIPDYATLTVAGLAIEAMPMPGVTLQHTGYRFRLGEQDLVVCGEAIAAPGRLYRVAPLQYNYNDLGGSWNVWGSARDLRRAAPDVLLPSMGEPILHDVDAALAALQDSIRGLTTMGQRFPDETAFGRWDMPELQQVTKHVWMSAWANARAWFIISETGKAMAIDYGYNWQRLGMQSQASPNRRRALLHGMGELRSRFGIERLDMVLVSHFHDDHVCGIPVLQRLHGTECWASEAFADLLEHPEAHCFPCTWPEPIRVDRRIPLDATVRWEEYSFHFGAMNGHTRFAALIGFEADGQRFAHTGDQYFNQDSERTRDFADNPVIANYVYRNGAKLDGYRQSEAWMLDWRPEIVLTGHTDALHTDDAYFAEITAFTARYEGLHRAAMQLDDDASHFDLDSWGGWLWPYRVQQLRPDPVTLKATVRNPLPRRARLTLRLVGPTGWDGPSTVVVAEPRAEVSVDLTISPTTACRRQPVVLELIADGQPHGYVAEAFITIGNPHF